MYKLPLGYNLHCAQNTRIRVFFDPYVPASEQDIRFCPYMEIYGSEKTRILANSRYQLKTPALHHG